MQDSTQPTTSGIVRRPAAALLCQEFIKRFPKTDHPAAFGQHVNADITSLIEETNALLGTMVR